MNENKNNIKKENKKNKKRALQILRTGFLHTCISFDSPAELVALLWFSERLVSVALGLTTLTWQEQNGDNNVVEKKKESKKENKKKNMKENKKRGKESKKEYYLKINKKEKN